jgi:hypothetical protein
MSATREVFGTIETVTGQPWKQGLLEFRLMSFGTGNAGVIVDKTVKTVRTGADGTFAVNLWVNEDSDFPAVIRCTLPSKDFFEFILPAGVNPIALKELAVLGIPEGTQQYKTVKDFLLANPELFEGPVGPAGPAGSKLSTCIKAGDTLTIGDCEALTLPFLTIEEGGVLIIEGGGVLDLR